MAVSDAEFFDLIQHRDVAGALAATDAACHATPAGWADLAGHAEIAALLSE